MKLSLVATQGKAQGKVIPVTLSQFIIGRDPECHLRPASPMISKRHCAVLVRGGKVFVRDFDSTNGTVLNDEPVKGERELKNNDKLKVGPLLFIVRIEASVTATKPAPVPAAAAPKAPVPARKTTAAQDDDSVAAMLLDLEGAPVAPENAADAGESIPSGSTVFEMPAIPADPNAAPPQDPNAKPSTAPAAAKPAAPKKAMGDTSAAAKAILDKYSRRPRS